MHTKNRLLLVVAGLLLLILLALWLTRPGKGAAGKNLSTAPTIPAFDRQGRRMVVTDKSIYRRANHQRRRLAQSTPESRSLLQRLIQQLQSGDEMQIVDAMIDAQELDSEDLIDFVKAALKSSDPDQREEALRMLVGVANPRVLEVVREAMRDRNPEMRMAALEALQYLDTEGGRSGGLVTASSGSASAGEAAAGDNSAGNAGGEEALNLPGEKPLAGAEGEIATAEDHSGATEGDDGDGDDDDDGSQSQFDYNTLSSYDVESIMAILASAFEDSEVQVRSAALQAIIHLELELQIKAFELAQKSSYDDVRGGVLFMTATSANFDTLMLAFRALDDSSEPIREAAKENLQHYLNTVEREFNSSAEALSWWQQNYHLYDDDLFISNLDNINIDDFLEAGAGENTSSTEPQP